MVVAVIGDGYVYGATEVESSDTAYNPRYWMQLRLDHEPHALYEAVVPPDLADKLEAQGTSEQVFSDGYEAMNAVAPYLEKEPFYESPEEWEQERDEEEMGEVREARPEPVDDPLYVIQGLYHGGYGAGGSFGFDDEQVAIDEAKKLARDPTFEGDYVRVITRDGELVWDSRHRHRGALEEATRRIPVRHEDAVIRDPMLLPDALSRRYAGDLRAQLGKGAKVQVVDSHTLLPRGWDFANITQLRVATPNREQVPITIRLNVAGNESSGNATIDAPGWGGTVAVARANTAEEAISAIVAELAGYLGSP